METSETSVSLPEFVGFLSVLDIEGVGFCGGYLLLNSSGRPVEFHCTLPVNPDRAQRILYGSTLEPFLYSEHIGKPLLEKSRLNPGAVFVEQASLLDLNSHTSKPVVHVFRESSESTRESSETDEAATDAPVPESVLRFKSGCIESDATARTLVDLLDQRIDLFEPFARIRDALNEAHSARAA